MIDKKKIKVRIKMANIDNTVIDKNIFNKTIQKIEKLIKFYNEKNINFVFQNNIDEGTLTLEIDNIDFTKIAQVRSNISTETDIDNSVSILFASLCDLHEKDLLEVDSK